jgi:hypothetical protein
VKRHRTFKASAAEAEKAKRHADAVGAPREIDSPYLTAAECAAYLRFASVESFYKFIPTSDIPMSRCGTRRFLFHRDDIAAWLRKSRAA